MHVKGGRVVISLHCEVQRGRNGKYYGFCLENSIAVVAEERREAKDKLERALGTYVDSLALELQRLVKSGRLSVSDGDAVEAEVQIYLQRVPWYPLRLAKWYLTYYRHRLWKALVLASQPTADGAAFLERPSIPVALHGQI